MATEIHPTAIIGEGAELDEDVKIGPFCVVSARSRIGKGTHLVSNVSLDAKVDIGEGCTVYPYTGIGFAPQDVKYKGEDTGVVIGSNNVIREYVSIHRGSVGGDGVTEMGDGNFIMAYAHVAHDCKLGDNIVMVNSISLAGHVEIGDYAFIGGFVGVHQFGRVGAHSMVAAFTRLSQDVAPYIIVKGTERARPYGINTIGLKRRGFSDETIAELKSAYRILFREKLSLKDALRKVQEELPYTDEIRTLVDFIQENKRGICK